MISLRNLILQFLYLLLWRPDLTIANCSESLNPKYWQKTKIVNISITGLTETIQLIDADSFENLAVCSLANEIIVKRKNMIPLLSQCTDEELSNVTDVKNLMKKLNCRDKLPQKVSFSEFMCMAAKAFNVHNEISACSLDTVVAVYLRFYATPTTTQPPTTPKQTTTMAQSTTAAISTQSSSIPVTPWSTRPSTSSVATQSSSRDVHNLNQQVKPPSEKDTDFKGHILYALLAASVLGNVVLALCLWKRSYHHGTTVHETVSLTSVDSNGHQEED